MFFNLLGYYESVIISEEVVALFCILKGNLPMNNHNKLIKMILAAFLLALAYVMPFLTGQIPEIGSMLCPMHIPVLLCGFICGAPWGLVIGFISPIFRSVLTGGFPPMFPTAICMAFELAAYGAIAGVVYKMLPRKKLYIYASLLISMLVGRLVWGIAMFICMGINGGSFTLAAFLAGAFTNAVPGIVVQIVLVPIVVMILENTKILNTKN